jgi:hypothetical protein
MCKSNNNIRKNILKEDEQLRQKYPIHLSKILLIFYTTFVIRLGVMSHDFLDLLEI